MIKNITTTLLTIFLLTSYSYTQDYLFTIYDESNSDLPNNNVSSVAIAPNGDKWFGTWGDGLAHFDGSQWTIYNTIETDLPSNSINDIVIDLNGNVWIGTQEGLVLFDGTNWTVYNSSNSGLPDNSVRSIYINLDDDVVNGVGLWIGTWGGGLCHFDGNQFGSMTVYDSDNSGIVGNSVVDIAIDNDNKIWTMSRWNGISVFDGTNWTIYNSANSPLPHNYVFSIDIDENGDQWIGGSGGLTHFSTSDTTVYDTDNSYIPHQSLRVVRIDDEQRVWVGTWGGLGIYEPSTDEWTQFYDDNSDLPVDNIRAIAHGGNGNHWIGMNIDSDSGDGGVAHMRDCSGFDIDLDVTHICADDCGEITVDVMNGSGLYNFTLYLDEVIETIEGQNAPATFTFDLCEPGNYMVEVEDLGGNMCSTDSVVAIEEYLIPNADVSYTNTSSCIHDDGIIIIDLDPDNNMDEILIEWSGEVSGSEVLTTESEFTLTDLQAGDYTVTIMNADNHQCEDLSVSQNITIGTNTVEQPTCLVTVDSVNADHNIVVWEKPEDLSAVDSFYVHREVSTGVYDKIGAVHADSLSQFPDHAANPNSTSFRYKISTLDVCGNESELSYYHNTIHLQYQGNGNFNWNHYTIEGSTDVVATYNFYRDNEGTGDWEVIQVVSGTQNSFSDIDYANYPDANYRVDVNWVDGGICTSTRAVDHNSSRSNIRGAASGGGGDCAAPTDPYTGNVGSEYAEIGWSSSESEWNLIWGESGFEIENPEGQADNINSNQYTIIGLQEATTYDVYIQSVCNGDESDWLYFTFNTSGVGVNEAFNNPNIKVFPNPASTYLDINIDIQEFNTGTLRIMDMTGKLVQASAVQSNMNRIDLNNFTNGIYFVEIAQMDGEIMGRYKVVVSK